MAEVAINLPRFTKFVNQIAHYRQVAPYLLPGVGWPLLAARNAWSLLESVLGD
jgi:hypothetical protein